MKILPLMLAIKASEEDRIFQTQKDYNDWVAILERKSFHQKLREKQQRKDMFKKRG